jgi:hypothetical protein
MPRLEASLGMPGFVEAEGKGEGFRDQRRAAAIPETVADVATYFFSSSGWDAMELWGAFTHQVAITLGDGEAIPWPRLRLWRSKSRLFACRRPESK